LAGMQQLYHTQNNSIINGVIVRWSDGHNGNCQTKSQTCWAVWYCNEKPVKQVDID